MSETAGETSQGGPTVFRRKPCGYRFRDCRLRKWS